MHGRLIIVDLDTDTGYSKLDNKGLSLVCNPLDFTRVMFSVSVYECDLDIETLDPATFGVGSQ